MVAQLFSRSIHFLFSFCWINRCRTISGGTGGRNSGCLARAKLDGWLFYDFRHSDPLAYRILKLNEKMFASRRWFYYVPTSGEPVKIVQSIEQFKLDSLPGRKLVFRGWQELHARLREVLTPAAKESKRRVAISIRR